MFVIGATPSGPVIWLALSRTDRTRAPAWALPCSGSLPSPPRVPLSTCMFQAVSVKPSR